jgi:hypothetical protein
MKITFINFPVFIISLILGILMVYWTAPDTKTVIVYPTDVIVYPTDDNKHLFQFRDKTNNCFQLNQRIVKCANDVEEIPIQI